MKYKYIKRIKSAVALTLVAALVIVDPVRVNATRSVSEIQADEDALQDEIDELDEELVDVLTQVDELEMEIADLEQEISDTEDQIAEAQVVIEKQYQDMKTRIKYMYEKQDDTVMTILLESGSFSDFLNRIEYTNSVYEYDQNQMDAYKANLAELQDLETILESDRAQLTSEKAELASQEESLNAMIAEKEAQMDDFDEELAAAKKAAEEAAKKAAEEAAIKAVTMSALSAGSSSSSSSSSADYSDLGGGNPASSVDGSAIVAYGQQFVGNPYVWGGNSLTDGCDCSGFVQQVYQHFGYLGGSRATSASLRSVGQAVGYEYMQPGDIVCYSGHVAIYAGGGIILEAQSKRTGITCNRSVTSKKILAIRRL